MENHLSFAKLKVFFSLDVNSNLVFSALEIIVSLNIFLLCTSPLQDLRSFKLKPLQISTESCFSIIIFFSDYFKGQVLDIFDFFFKEVLRLFNRAHRVTVQKTIDVAGGGCAVVFTRFVVARVDTSSNRRFIRKEKDISIVKT